MPLTYTTNLNLVKPDKGYIDWDDEVNGNFDTIDTSITTNSTAIATHTSNVSNPHSTTAAQVGAIETSTKAAAGGVASLDSNTWVPSTQLGNLLWKAPVRVVSTSVVTISSPGATIDAITMATGDRVLLTAQSTASQNGIYVYSTSSTSMTRATDGDTSSELLGAYYTAKEGTGVSKIWYNTNTSSITVGSTSITYSNISNTNTAAGDLTGSYPNPAIASNAVTNSKLTTRAATSRIMGSTSSSTAVSDLTATEVTAMLNPFVGISGTPAKGLVPAPGAITSSYFLAADGSWSVPSGTAGLTSASIPSIEAGTFAARPSSSYSTNRIYYATDTFTFFRDNGSAWQTIAPALSGAITTTGGSLTTSLSDSVVTNAKLASMANSTIKGNISGSSAAPSDLTQAQVKTFVGIFSTSVTGLVPAASTSGDTAKFLKGDGSWGTPTVGAATSVANALTFNNGGSGSTSGITFDGSSAITISYNTIGATKTDGSNATGTWTLSISGNAATATKSSNITGGAQGDLLYQSGSDTTTKLSLGTQYKILQAGAVGPVWSPYTLPSDNGTANYALITNGSGSTSWSQVPVATGISGLGTGIATFLATPTSANLISAVTNETGTGSLVFSTSPALTTPTLGVATATSINGLTISTTTGILSITNGKTLAATNTLTFTGTDASSIAFGTGGTVAYTSNKLSVFAATSSAEFAGIINDETGTGSLVFANSPTLVTPVLGTPSSGTLTSCTGLPVATGISGLGTGIATFLATPTSANLISAVTNETGTGSLVFATGPTFTGITVNNTAIFNGSVSSPFVALVDGVTISVNASLGNNFKITLGGNRTMGEPTSPSDGQTITFHISQDGTGNRTLTWASAYKWPSGIPPTLTAAASALDIVSCTYNSSLSSWYCTATRNFS